MFFDPPGTRNDLLVDCGREQSVDSVVKPFLRSQGVDRLGGFLVTHGETRVMGGAQTVREVFRIDHIYASVAPSRSPDYRSFIDSCSAVTNLLTRVKGDDPIGSWVIRSPNAALHFTQADDNAVAMLGNIRGVRVLALSELGLAGQKALAEQNPEPRADIVISGIPARGEPLSDRLLDVVQPRLIIITDSEIPAQQRAKKSVIARLAKRNIPVIYTQSAGAVTLEFKSGHWSMRTMKRADVPIERSGENHQPLNDAGDE